MEIEVKSINSPVIDVDTKTRRVKTAISETESKDLQNDVIAKDAYTKTISERGPKGQNLIWHLTDHYADTDHAINKFDNLEMEGNKLTGITTFPNTSKANDMLELYNVGAINQHSVGFKTIRQEQMNKGEKDEYTLIKEIKLYEGSTVLWGANPNTPTLWVGKSYSEMNNDQKAKQLELWIAEYKKLCYVAKKGNFTDETAQLFEIKSEFLASEIKSLFKSFTTITHAEPPADSPAPIKNEDISFSDRLKLLSLSIS